MTDEVARRGQRIPSTLRVIGVRPENVPEDWAIHKAVRPLCGDMLWNEDGCYFAAVAPHLTTTAYLNGQNWASQAVTLEYVALETAIAEQFEWYKVNVPKIVPQIDLTDHAIRARLTAAWRTRHLAEYERAIAETA